MTGLTTYLLILVGGLAVFALVGTLWVNSQQKTLRSLRLQEIQTRQEAKAAEAREAEEAKHRTLLNNPFEPVPHGAKPPDAVAAGIAMSGMLTPAFNLSSSSLVAAKGVTLSQKAEEIRKILTEREAKGKATKPDLATTGEQQIWWGVRRPGTDG